MDVDAWLACFADDAVSYAPYGAPPIQRKDELRAFFVSVTITFTEIGFTEDFPAVTGNRAAMKFTARRVATNGKAAACEGIDVFEVNDGGTIQTMWGYWDPVRMMAQLEA